MIIESLVTTMDSAGGVNLAPMGVEWGEQIVLKPFLDTTTFRNLVATRSAVLHLTDDVLLFVQAALGEPRFAWRPAASVQGAVLDDACSWRELEVTTTTQRHAAGMGRRKSNGARPPPSRRPPSSTKPPSAKTNVPMAERAPRPTAAANSAAEGTATPRRLASPRPTARPSWVPEPSPACDGNARRTSMLAPAESP